ncbi:MAG TPA: four helix bundle protein [Bryocella sp.]|nr:four helix bundle protein [Bryocella sp.]
MRNHEDLEVWQKAHAITIRVYRITAAFPRSEMFGLTSQIRRAAASIGANLAEGCGRWSEAEMAHFVQIAMGCASELHNHLRLASDLGFLAPPDYHSASKDLISVRQMLTAFLQSRRGVRDSKKFGAAPLAKGE